MNTQHAAHDTRLLRSGVALFAALIEAVDQAQHEVLLETYIFDFAGAGADVGHALARAAQRGVRVCVVVDGVGTGALPRRAYSAACIHRWQVLGFGCLAVGDACTASSAWWTVRWRFVAASISWMTSSTPTCLTV